MNAKWDKRGSPLKQIWQALTVADGETPLHVSPVQMLESFHTVSLHKALLLYVEAMLQRGI